MVSNLDIPTPASSQSVRTNESSMVHIYSRSMFTSKLCAVSACSSDLLFRCLSLPLMMHVDDLTSQVQSMPSTDDLPRPSSLAVTQVAHCFISRLYNTYDVAHPGGRCSIFAMQLIFFFSCFFFPAYTADPGQEEVWRT